MTTAIKKHSEYSSSGAKRYINCAASISLSKLAPVQPDNPAALEGTKAHECLEKMLKDRYSMSRALQEARMCYMPEMVENCAWAFLEINKLLKKYPGAEFLIERKVDTSHFTAPDNFGTTDSAIVAPFDTLVVIDFKYGVMPVEAKENEQLISYALALAKEYDYCFEKVKFVILQPRSRSQNRRLSIWDTRIENLVRWEDTFKRAVAKTKEKNPAHKVGEWCFFCPSRTFNCPAHKEKINRKAADVFADYDNDDDDWFENFMKTETKRGKRNGKKRI